MFAVILVAVLLVTTNVDAAARSSSSIIYDHYDIVRGKQLTIDCTKTCSVYASTTGSSPYEAGVLLAKTTTQAGLYDTLSTLQDLAVPRDGSNNGPKKQLKATGVLVLMNNNTVVDPARPYYILCVFDSQTANHDYDVYELSAGVVSTTQEGITLMTPASDAASSLFALSTFDIKSGTGLSIYPGAYDYDHDLRNALLTVSSQNAASTAIFPIMTPVVTVVANGKAKADAFTFSVDKTTGRTWKVAKGGSFAFYSPGYSGTSASLRSLVPTGTRYVFNFDATAFVDFTATYYMSIQDECDFFINDAKDPLVYTFGSGSENVTGLRDVNKLQFECDWKSNAGSVFQIMVTSAGAVGSYAVLTVILAISKLLLNY